MTSAVVRVAGALATVLVLAGCMTGGGGKVYEVGDCLKVKPGADGRAVKTECTDPESMKVVDVATNGQRPHCPGGSAVSSFVEDSATRVTYCGPYNR